MPVDRTPAAAAPVTPHAGSQVPVTDVDYLSTLLDVDRSLMSSDNPFQTTCSRQQVTLLFHGLRVALMSLL